MTKIILFLAGFVIGGVFFSYFFDIFKSSKTNVCIVLIRKYPAYLPGNAVWVFNRQLLVYST